MDLLRGYNNRFFYIEKNSESYLISELVIGFRSKENQWTHKTSTIFSSSYGRILALQLDHNNAKKTDTFWSKESILEFNNKVSNQIFLIDSAQNLIKLKQADDAQYNQVLKINLAYIEGLQPELEWLRTNETSKVSISDRSITIRGTHFIYKTGHQSQIKLADPNWSVLSS